MLSRYLHKYNAAVTTMYVLTCYSVSVHVYFYFVQIICLLYQWRTYRTNKPGGAFTQLEPCTINRQHPFTSLCRSHSLYPAFVNTCCRYALY